jgi:uncharacterized NAD(P)/FAD-binding protein YdhS
MSQRRGAYRILQVGCGPTGTSVLRQLLPRLSQAGVTIRFDVADPATMGPGLAFATPYDLHLLNVRADRMSLDPDDRGEFARWRTAHESVWAADLGNPASGWHDYPPRRLFGMYLRDVLSDTLRSAGAREQRVDLIADTIVAARRDTVGRWHCRFSSGAVGEYDRVILAVGHLPSARYAPEDGRAGFLRSVWGELPFRADARVGVIGTRLTAIDAALALHERGHRGPVTLASRTGWLPSVKGRTTAGHELGELPDFVARQRDGAVPLREVAAVVRREIEAAHDAPIDWQSALHPPPSTVATLREELAIAESGQVVAWQSVLSAIVPWVPALWRLLEPAGRELLMSRYVGAWAVRIASFPAITARRLLGMTESGQLAIGAGLRAVRVAGSGYRMVFDDDAVAVDVVINATGPGYGRDSLDATALTRDLLRSGAVTPHRYGGVQVDERTFEPIDAHGVASPGMHVVGDLTRGVWLATNAVENTVRQSVELAEVLARQLSGARPHG